jgi:hypothetical protein
VTCQCGSAVPLGVVMGPRLWTVALLLAVRSTCADTDASREVGDSSQQKSMESPGLRALKERQATLDAEWTPVRAGLRCHGSPPSPPYPAIGFRYVQPIVRLTVAPLGRWTCEPSMHWHASAERRSWEWTSR